MKITLLSILILCVSIGASAQDRWKAYDSIYFENLFLPNFSNLLMPKGYVEVLLSNALSTANHGWSNNSGSTFDLNGRYTFNFTTAIANFGVSKSGRFNAGLEIHYGMGYHDSDPESSPLEIFKSSSPGMVQSASGLTSIGPRFKFRPIKSNSHFVYTTSLQLPLLSNSQAENLLESRIYWGNQFLYSFNVGKHLVFFAQDDVYIYFGEGLNSHNQYYEGLSFYGYVLATKHFYPFVSIGYGGLFGTEDATGDFKNWYHTFPLGGGLQYQFSMRFTVNVLYNGYVWGKNTYDMRTVNLGLRGVFSVSSFQF